MDYTGMAGTEGEPMIVRGVPLVADLQFWIEWKKWFEQHRHHPVRLYIYPFRLSIHIRHWHNSYSMPVAKTNSLAASNCNSNVLYPNRYWPQICSPPSHRVTHPLTQSPIPPSSHLSYLFAHPNGWYLAALTLSLASWVQNLHLEIHGTAAEFEVNWLLYSFQVPTDFVIVITFHFLVPQGDEATIRISTSCRVLSAGLIIDPAQCELGK